jgi:hypothetical protein
MCDFVVILSCNRIKLRTSLFFNTQQTADTQERERERERENMTQVLLSSSNDMCLNLECREKASQMIWMGGERAGMVLKGGMKWNGMEWNKMSDT